MKGQHKLTELIGEMIELIITLKEQSNDNPEVSDSIFGLSILNQTNILYNKLNEITNT